MDYVYVIEEKLTCRRTPLPSSLLSWSAVRITQVNFYIIRYPQQRHPLQQREAEKKKNVSDQRRPWLQSQYLPIAPANMLSFRSDVHRSTGKQLSAARLFY